MKSIRSGRELLNQLKLENIQFYEVRARLYAGFGEAPSDSSLPSDAAASGGGSDENSEQRWKFLVQLDIRNVNLRAQLEIRGPDARYNIDAAVFYSSSDDFQVARESLEEFLNRAAMLAIYPFIREALHESARKIGASPPLLGMFDAESIQIDLTDSDEEPRKN
ncbi:hypothetical protein [Amycolatopsis magusensis]|uniref:hypothetical protein n=1 Tax=Amycolatopsis magusensis TaxID=882444 RepID=UPI0037B4C849